jgi:hypothetical protein
MAGERHVVVVDMDGDAALRPGALGEADMVEVRVGEHDRGDVRQATPERGQRLLQRLPRTRDARVDDGQSSVVLDQIPVRVGVLDAVDARTDVLVQHPAGLPGRRDVGTRRHGAAGGCAFAQRWDVPPNFLARE